MPVTITIIDENECIGNSLQDINANFYALSAITTTLQNLNTTSINALSADLVNLKNILNA
jgi:hypothetical protein